MNDQRATLAILTIHSSPSSPSIPSIPAPESQDQRADATLAIVAERRLTVAALSALLLKEPGYRVIHEARGASQVREALDTHRPGVIVTDDDAPLSGSIPRRGQESGRRGLWVVVDPLDDPSGFLATVHAAIERSGGGQLEAHLSGREREILAQIATGRSTKQVARHCAITPKTVGNHISHIRRKLNLHHRGELVLFAIEQGLVHA